VEKKIHTDIYYIEKLRMMCKWRNQLEICLSITE